MDKEDKNYSSENFNKINEPKNQNNNSNLLKTKLIISYDLVKKELNSNIVLSDLKKFINTNFNLNEIKYELYIGENSINNLPDDTSILNLINKYNLNKVTIRSFKNVFDVKNELNTYETFLTKNITLKNDEIDLIQKEYENIKKDLQNM
jgi:hypothetical protein